MKNLKTRITSGEVVYGCWVNMGSLVSAEIVGKAGFDWVLIDLEHGAVNDNIMYQQLQVLSGSPVTSLVRIDEITRPKVQRIMDAGAAGIMFPHVLSAKEAAEAVEMLYYPPVGSRGMAKMVRATGFGVNADNYMAQLGEHVLGIVQIETEEALKDIDKIAAAPNVDVLFVGPSDLSLAMGIFGQLDHPRYQQAIQEVAAAAKKHGKATGVLLLDIKEHEMYYTLGYRFLACGADSSFVVKGAGEMVKQLKNFPKT
ncbi:MAG TPA: aldolase/citrate lyase family protein [Cyclobacteriaceae bacterium]|nr:aldolase/citrate lyase family protein [Cyclobacteriaceae bacterium]